MDGLANKIRSARRNADLSQKELGNKLGISDTAISAYETGRAIPPFPTLKEIGKITDTSIDFFTEENNEEITLKKLDRNIRKIKKDVAEILNFLKK